MKKIVFMLSVVLGLLSFGIIPAMAASEDATDISWMRTEREQEDKDDYDELTEKVWDDTGATLGQLADTGGELGKSAVNTFWTYVFYMYDVISGIYPALLIFSLTIGFLVAILSTKNKKRRRYAIVVGCITIPAITTLIVYVLPYIYIRLS